MTDRRPDTITYIALAVGLLFWAAAFPGIRVGLQAYSPGEVALLRFGTASLTFAALALVRRMRLPARRDWGTIALAGVLGISIYHVALNYGEVTVESAAAALLISAVPVFTALLSIPVLGERLSAWGWAGVSLAFSGAAIVALGEGGGVHFDPGAALILLAALSAAGYMVVSKRSLGRYGAVEFTAFAVWAGTVPLLVFAPGLVRTLPVAPLGPTLAVVFLGIFPGALSYLLWSYALARMPASVTASFLYAQPLNAAIIAWLWLGEVPSPITISGGLVALGGVIVVNTLGWRGAERPDAAYRIVPADSPERAAVAAGLLRAYSEWLGPIGGHTTVAAEIADPLAAFGPPEGRMLLALDASSTGVGCVGVRPGPAPGEAEIKRLFVVDAHRGRGVGRLLAEAAVDAARELGYERAVLDTVGHRMVEALRLYGSLGFEPVPAFNDTPIDGMVYLGRTLGDQ